MSMNILETLLSDEFQIAVGFVGTPWAVHQVLSRTPQVHAIRQGLRQGAITEETIRRFVARVLSDLRRGERFAHELALAALAVALQTRPTDFAEEFLHDLSRLQLAEMSLCIRVARLCLVRRVSLTRATAKQFNAGTAQEGESTGEERLPSDMAGGWFCSDSGISILGALGR